MNPMKPLATLTSLALIAAACAPLPSPSSAVVPAGSLVTRDSQHAAVRVAVTVVNPTPATFRTMLAPGQTRLANYVMTLKQGATTISGPTNDADGVLVFNSVAVGNGYTIEVSAVDAAGNGVLTGTGTSASFDVHNGQVYATTDVARATPLANVTVNVTFLDENIGPTVRITGSTVATKRTGVSFLNLQNWKSVALEKAVGANPTDFQIGAVAQGATTGVSHKLYTYFADTTLLPAPGQATVAKAQNIPGTAAGDVKTDAGWSPLSKAFSMVQAPTATGHNDTVGNPWVGADTFAVTFDTGPNQFRDEQGAIRPLGDMNNYPNVGSYTADKDGNIYYWNTADNIIYKVEAGGPTAVTGTITAPVNNLTVDASGSFYWLDGAGAAKKLPTIAFSVGGNDSGDLIAIHAGPYTGIAVDAFGNAYLGTATAITKAVVVNTINYDPPVAHAAGAAITNLIGDPAGNLYFLDGAAAGNLRMRPAGQNSVYTVTGTTGVAAARPAIAADGTLVYVDGANDVQKL
jgi:hypothetical protein